MPFFFTLLRKRLTKIGKEKRTDVNLSEQHDYKISVRMSYTCNKSKIPRESTRANFTPNPKWALSAFNYMKS